MTGSRLEELRRRVELNPAAPAFAALGEEYRKAGRFDEAIEACRAGLERFPAYLSARVTLGRALVEVGELEEARAQLEEVVSAAPENLAAIRALADIHHRLGDPQADAEVDALAALLDATPSAGPIGGDANTEPPDSPAVTEGVGLLEDFLPPLLGAAAVEAAESLAAPESPSATAEGVAALEELLSAPPGEGGVGDEPAPAPDDALRALEEIVDAGAVPEAPAFDTLPEMPSTVEATFATETEQVDVSEPVPDIVMEEDPRVLEGLERFLDAVLADRAARGGDVRR